MTFKNQCIQELVFHKVHALKIFQGSKNRPNSVTSSVLNLNKWMNKQMKERMFFWKRSRFQQIKNKAFRHCFSVCPKPTSSMCLQRGISGLDLGLLCVVLLLKSISRVYQFFSHLRKQSLEFTMIHVEDKRTKLWLTDRQPSQCSWQNRLKSQRKRIGVWNRFKDFKSGLGSVGY